MSDQTEARSFERTDGEILSNAGIPLFSIKGKMYKVRLRVARMVDEWLADSDGVIDIATEIDLLQNSVAVWEQRYAEELARNLDEPPGPIEQTEPTRTVPGSPVCDDQDESGADTPSGSGKGLEWAHAGMLHARAMRRTRVRDFMESLADLVFSYDEVPVELRPQLTDEQVLSAFTTLRYFSDPLVAQRRVSELLAARLQ